MPFSSRIVALYLRGNSIKDTQIHRRWRTAGGGRGMAKQQPIIDGSGKGMAAVNNYGDDDHTAAGDDDDRALED